MYNIQIYNVYYVHKRSTGVSLVTTIIIYRGAVQFENRRVRNLFFAQGAIGQKLFSSCIKSYGLLYIHIILIVSNSTRYNDRVVMAALGYFRRSASS